MSAKGSGQIIIATSRPGPPISVAFWLREMGNSPAISGDPGGSKIIPVGQKGSVSTAQNGRFCCWDNLK